MPTTLPDLVLLNAKAATGAGSSIGFAERVRYGNGSGINRNGFPTRLKVRLVLADSTTGASATVVIEDSDDDVTFTTLTTYSMSIASTAPNSQMKDGLFVTSRKFIRANVTAIAGGSAPTVTGYCTLGAFGV